MDLQKAWNSLYEGDLKVLAEELGVIPKGEPDGCEKNKRLLENTGEPGLYTGWPYSEKKEGSGSGENET